MEGSAIWMATGCNPAAFGHWGFESHSGHFLGKERLVMEDTIFRYNAVTQFGELLEIVEVHDEHNTVTAHMAAEYMDGKYLDMEVDYTKYY